MRGRGPRTVLWRMHLFKGQREDEKQHMLKRSLQSDRRGIRRVPSMETTCFKKYIARMKYVKWSWKMSTKENVMNAGDWISCGRGPQSFPSVVRAERRMQKANERQLV